MIFTEYIEHDRAMPFQIFRKLGHQDWTGEGDRMIANLGRTQRLATRRYDVNPGRARL